MLVEWPGPGQASYQVNTSAGVFSVRAVDSSGAPVSGAYVRFALARGSGRVSPVADTTDANGIARTTVILGTTPGPHVATAAARGDDTVETGIIDAVPGPTARLNLSASRLTMLPTQDSVLVNAVTEDAYGNATGASELISWTSRNPALVQVSTSTYSPTVRLRVMSRPGETWVIAQYGHVIRDSMLVRALDSGTTCAFAAPPTALAVGAAFPFHATGTACLSPATDADYVIVAHYNTTVNSTSATVHLTGTGIAASTASYPTAGGQAVATPEMSFERTLRASEREGMAPRVSGARAWYGNRPPAIRALLKENDETRVNTNPSDFCANPRSTPARVAAITQTAVILSDMENPPGGFTDEEYRAIGATIDTLAHPVVTAAFGAPTDIDGNDRIVVLFTKAVNAITPRGSSGAVLGFFFSRDLLPQSGANGCAGSNVGEMFYVMVPDPTAVVSDARSKAFVSSIVASTIAHELQHLINSSRRLYVTNASETNEELWLNEGLSHIAEELAFYRASGLSPRQNLDSSTIKASGQRAMLDLYQRGNFRRLEAYLRAPDSNAPMAENDQLATRGSAWAFLRYLADRSRATDGDLWRRLVDSPVTGARNLDEVLQGTGLTTLGLLEEWSRAVVSDDIIPGTTAQQPSWSFVTAMPLAGYPFSLSPYALQNGTLFVIPVRGSSSFYGRFAVTAGQQALIQATGPGGGTIPPGMRLTIIRIK